MKSHLIRCLLVVFCVITINPLLAWAQKYPNPASYLPTIEQIVKIKAPFDDPSDANKVMPPKKVLPPEILKEMTFDLNEMKKGTEEVLGFKAPDVVGKIAPEIMPGKYTYKDLEKAPGLKKLLPPFLLRHVRQGGPPTVGGIVDFEIEPTMQMHWYPGKINQTKKSAETAKLDKDGYLVAGSWQGGVPFPRPTGPQKARQVLYNMDRRSNTYDYNCAVVAESWGFDKNLKIDSNTKSLADFMKLGGRSFFPPYGWYDERARKNGEIKAFMVAVLAPRSVRGTNQLQYFYDSPDKQTETMVWVPSLRRVRKLSATDTQDQGATGGDMCYDDQDFFQQKLSRKVYPYECKVEESEYLLPYTLNASTYVDSKQGYAMRDLKLQRRPVWVLEMKQLDPTYVYSKRVLIIDREFNSLHNGDVYDQKGRLYRSQYQVATFYPEFGDLHPHGQPSPTYDLIDTHSSVSFMFQFPAPWGREHFSLEEMVKLGK